MLKRLFDIRLDRSDIFLTIGILSLFYGIQLINRPVAIIVVASLFIILGCVAAWIEVKITLYQLRIPRKEAE